MPSLTLVIVTAVFGCGDDGIVEVSGGTSVSSTTLSSEPESTGDPTAASSTSASTSAGGSTTNDTAGDDGSLGDDGIGGDYETTGSCGFTCPSGGGGGSSPNASVGCSIGAQNCPPDELCAPWAPDGGLVWSGTRCVPAPAAPQDFGDRCTWQGFSTSGIDTCGPGLWCAPTSNDPESTSGVCIALCGHSGICPQGQLCMTRGPLDIGFCSDLCDPTDPEACPADWGCAPTGFSFACKPDGNRALGESCEDSIQCPGSSTCADTPGCEGDGLCCVAFCDLTAPACAEGQTCEDFGSSLSAYDHVGLCNG